MSSDRKISQSSGEAAYAALMAALRDGTYAPGERLREEEVGERLGLSRTPVREALRRLEAHGVVEHRPRLGAVIRSLGHTETVELYEMRIVLERTAAEMAARHGAEAEFDTLGELNDSIEDQRDNPSIGSAINQDFHRCLYLAGRNRFLLDAARAITNSLLLLGPTTYSDPERVDVVVAEHRMIVDALRTRDAKAAGEAAEAHLQNSLRYRLKGLGA
ncbi:GntR family transcriptional regulator [Oricola cellulosilytica]|uniref:GntR family transcriptional regulator n=1 Tax=Oricola cellulosilytica TaxID=1429082 RepID=A0A4R0PDI3_9HYPH|nr:GntR family transcriptional regulator [Oricola cellulosilytica]TCD13306.1 GntR family transcriptional regulator [Oricola cellulosilytica]